MKPLRVMLIEDEVLIRILLKRYLEDLNCQIIFESGYAEDAIEALKNEDCDLICLDIKLQGNLNGIDAVGEINKIKQLPIIFMSAYDDDSYLKKMNFPNKYAFLIKPIEKNQLKTVINDINHSLMA